MIDYYSHPQVGGAIRVRSRRQDGGGAFSSIGKYAIPIFRNIKEKASTAARGVADAIKTAGGKAIKKFVREAPKVGVKRALQAGSTKFRQKFAGAAEGIVSKALNDEPEEKVREGEEMGGGEQTGSGWGGGGKRKRHKRSRVDEVLGNDSYL